MPCDIGVRMLFWDNFVANWWLLGVGLLRVVVAR